MGMTFSFFAIIFIVIFLMVTVTTFVIFGFVTKRFFSEWNNNRQQPVVSLPAAVVAKRVESGSTHHLHGGHRHHHRSTRYYVTFELETGERREFALPGSDYGLLAEGDEGELQFQGTWFRGFNRRLSEAPPVMTRAGTEANQNL